MTMAASSGRGLDVVCDAETPSVDEAVARQDALAPRHRRLGD